MSEATQVRAEMRRFERAEPEAADLGRLLAPAVFVHQELLRAMRLALLPQSSPAVEAALWFSPWVATHNAAGLAFRPTVIRLLREQLRRQWRHPATRARIERARQVMERVHRDLSPALALEERVAWHAIAGDETAMQEDLEQAVKAFAEGDRPGIAAWAAQAWNRLPPEAQRTRAGWMLHQVARTVMGPQRLRPLAVPVEGGGSELAVVVAHFREVKLGLHREGSRLEVGNVGPSGSVAFRVPDTSPRLVEVIWRMGDAERTEALALLPGEQRVVEVGLGPVRLRTAKGTVYELPPVGGQSGAGENSWAVLTVQALSDGSLSLRSRLGAERGPEALLTPKMRLLLDQNLGFIGNPRLWRETFEKLSGLMLPPELKAAAPLDFNWVLVLDPDADFYPWELYRESRERAWEHLSLRRGIVRQLQRGVEPTARSNPVPAGDSSPHGNRAVLIQGEPPEVEPTEDQTDGPTAMVEPLAHMLEGAGLDSSRLPPGTHPKRVLKELFREDVRLLHVAATTARIDPESSEPGMPVLWLDRDGRSRLSGDEFAALERFPELVFFNLGFRPGGRRALPQRRLRDPGFPLRLASDWARRLLELGARCVVLNAWTVEDEEALAFTTAYYRQILEGRAFWEALRSARRAVFEQFPDSNSWAAYRGYGDPHFVLRWQAPRAQPQAAPVRRKARASGALLSLAPWEQKLVAQPGVWRCGGVADLQLESLSPGDLGVDQPLLLLVHGLASNTRGTFGDLWSGPPQSAWAPVRGRFAPHVLAFEHFTLTESPVANALLLSRALPPGATLYLLAHSMGGLIGELLCRGSRVGHAPFDAEDLALFDGDSEQQHALRALGAVLQEKRFRIERFIRVGCPARGTAFVKKMGRLFTTAMSFWGNTWFEHLLTLWGSKRPEEIPGLAAIAPEAPLIRMLNRPDVRVNADLSVVTGRHIAGSLTQRLTTMVSNAVLEGDHDLLVSIASMDGGALRSGSVFRADFAGPDINHATYFRQEAVVRAIADRLLHATPGPAWRRIESTPAQPGPGVQTASRR